MTMVSDWSQPPGRLLDTADRLLFAPWRTVTSPVFHGLDNLPSNGPMLLVGNHTLYGMIDAPILIMEIYKRTGRWIRSLVDHVHYRVPLWRELLTYGGSVDGTPDNARELLAAGQAILIFPGGAREVTKRRGEKYQVIWGERLGFARLAIEAGCPVVPFGAVGVEDMFTIMVDSDSRLLAPARRAAARVFGARGRRNDLVFPLSRGLGPTPFPRPERLYFAVGEPIDTTPWAGRADDHRAQVELRDQTRDAVEKLIGTLREEQASDPRRRLRGRIASRVTEVVPGLPR